MKRLLNIVTAIGISLTLGCSTTRHLQSNQTLLHKQQLIISSKADDAEKVKKVLEDNIKPKPNKKFLGMRIKLSIYEAMGTPKKRGLRQLIRRKLGERPVLAQSVDIANTQKAISATFENSGFFNTKVAADSSTYKKRTTITYHAYLGKRYRIRNVVFPADSSAISKIIQRTKGASILSTGQYFNLDNIKGERERIDQELKQQGYFFFNPDYLVAQVDSSHLGNLDIYIKIKQDAPLKALVAYRIDSIEVFPTYTINQDSLLMHSSGIDTSGITVIDPQQRYRPSIFARAIEMRRGDLYTRDRHSRSLTRVVNLDAFQFVNLTFKESQDSGKLNASFLLTPSKRNSLIFGVTASTKSNNYLNAELKATVKNRNLFRGAEILELTTSGGFNAQYGGAKSAANSYSAAADLSITTPRLTTPFKKFNWYNAEATRTKAAVGYEYVSRQPDYTIHALKGSFGYIWKKHQRDQHELTLLNLNVVRPVDLSSKIDSVIKVQPALRQSLNKQLILGTIYSFTYSNQLFPNKRHHYYLNATQELVGNLLDLAKGGSSSGYDQKSILGIPYSQYSRSTIDYRSYLHLNSHTTLASRIYLGIAIPYGNSKAIPYTKQFYSGGSNSLRGFKAYTVGPGAYHSPDITIQTNQTGDIKLEANAELRTDLVGMLKGAVFVDAGNIWLFNKDISQADADFRFNTFYQQLAVSAGAGVRLDLSFFVLRLDLAIPLRKPYLPEGKRWVLDGIDFGSKSWRSENLLLNIAIGYPF